MCFVGGSDSRSTRGYYIVKPFNYLGKLLSRNIRPVLNECTIVCRGWCTFRCNPLSSSPPPRNSFLPLLFYPLRLFFVSTFFRFFDVFLSLSLSLLLCLSLSTALGSRLYSSNAICQALKRSAAVARLYNLSGS